MARRQLPKKGGAAERKQARLHLRVTPHRKLAFESLETRRLLAVDVRNLELASNSVAENDNSHTLLASVTRQTEDTQFPLHVALRSSVPSLVQVPNAVTIPGGASTIQFFVSPIDNFMLTGDQNVDISAFASGFQHDSETLTVRDHETLTVEISVDRLYEGQQGSQSQLTVRRNNINIDTDVTVQLSGDPAGRLQAPSQLVIPAGMSEAMVVLQVADQPGASAPEVITLTAAATGYASDSDSVQVVDPEYLSVNFAANSVAENAGPDAVALTIERFDLDLSSDLVIDLQTTDTSELTGPATATIPAGKTTAQVHFNAIDDQELDGSQSVQVIANALGHQESRASIDVTDFEALSLQIAEERIHESQGEQATTATISRSTLDVSEPLRVAIFNSDGTEIAVPSTVEIPAGETMVTFFIDAIDDNLVDGIQNVELTISAIGFEETLGTLQVVDSSVASWTNPVHPFDVDANLHINVRDVLLLIYDLRTKGPRRLTPPEPGNSPPPYVDANRDTVFNTADIFSVINFLNEFGPMSVENAPDAEGEGERNVEPQDRPFGDPPPMGEGESAVLPNTSGDLFDSDATRRASDSTVLRDDAISEPLLPTAPSEINSRTSHDYSSDNEEGDLGDNVLDEIINDVDAVWNDSK